MNRRLVNNILVALIIIIIMLLSYMVIKPILISMTFGLLFAYIFHPIYKKINKTIKNKTLSASLLMSLIAFLITIPAIYFTPKLIQQIFSIFEKVKEVNIAETIATLFPFLAKDPTSYSILVNFNNIPGKVTSSLIDTLLQMALNLPDLLIQTFVFLFTFFFAIRDSHKLGHYFNEISPFSKTTEKKFLREFRGITNSVILGQVLIGFLQGITLGLGLWLLGVPNVLTWTLITIIASIIPMIGPWLVWVPISIFLLLAGDTTGGIVLALYGGLFVSSIDNFVRPYLLSKSSKLPLVVSLIGTVGGFYFLGILGLVIGPLILAYALIIIDFYKEGRLDELYRESKQGIKNYEIKS